MQDVGAERDAITLLRSPTHFGRPNWDKVFSSIRERHVQTDVGVVSFSVCVSVGSILMMIRCSFFVDQGCSRERFKRCRTSILSLRELGFSLPKVCGLLSHWSSMLSGANRELLTRLHLRSARCTLILSVIYPLTVGSPLTIALVT
jgi:hypothetical protein